MMIMEIVNDNIELIVLRTQRKFFTYRKNFARIIFFPDNIVYIKTLFKKCTLRK